MPRLPMGRYWGLRRLADDGGRFMLLDLRAATGEALADLARGLTPFATGVLLEPAALDIWRRWGSPHVGRIDAVTDQAEVEEAHLAAADAMLAPAALADVTKRLAIARLGQDTDADLGLDRPSGLRVVTCGGPEAGLLEDAAGYLSAASLIAPALRAADPSERRSIIADALVPKLQMLNAQVADLPEGSWLDD